VGQLPGVVWFVHERFAELNPKVLLISNRLSDVERDAVRQVDDEFAGDVVDDLILAANEVAAPPARHAAGGAGLAGCHTKTCTCSPTW
jgi:hypothetical protein